LQVYSCDLLTWRKTSKPFYFYSIFYSIVLKS
jgi:hypothetical protein